MAHEHTPVPIFSEGVDLESLVIVGYLCNTCGVELSSLVPRPVPEYVIQPAQMAA